jgi:hypothetical protein
VLAFIAPITFATPQSGLARLQFEIGSDGDGRTGLIMTWSPWRPPADGDPPDKPPAAQSRLIFPAATQFQLRYFGAASASQKPDWTETWTRMDKIPDLIEFRISNGPVPPDQALDTRIRRVVLHRRLP